MSVSDLPGSSNSGTGPLHSNPSVSKAQWASYALRKLGEGYVLLQSPNGRAFHFYRAGEPLQPCAPHAAHRLIQTGLLAIAKQDARGTHYTTAASLQDDQASA